MLLPPCCLMTIAWGRHSKITEPLEGAGSNLALLHFVANHAAFNVAFNPSFKVHAPIFVSEPPFLLEIFGATFLDLTPPLARAGAVWRECEFHRARQKAIKRNISSFPKRNYQLSQFASALRPISGWLVTISHAS